MVGTGVGAGDGVGSAVGLGLGGGDGDRDDVGDGAVEELVDGDGNASGVAVDGAVGPEQATMIVSPAASAMLRLLIPSPWSTQTGRQ